MNIYVGNLSYETDEDTIRGLFEAYGEVYSVKLIVDHETGRRKGFGFVEMEQNGGRKAIDALNNYECNQRNLKVNEARERKEQNRRSNFRRSY